MARIRSIHPGLWMDEAFVGCSPLARLLWIGLWGEADDHGVFEWKATVIRMRILPGDLADVPALLAELAKAELIMAFSEGGRSFGAIRNFLKWQRPKVSQFLYPCPPEVATFVRLRQEPEAERPDRGTALGKMLCEKQNGRCHYCDTEITFYRKKLNSLEIDHKTPLSRGGADDFSNLAAACRPCNQGKGNMTEAEFRASDKLAKILSQAAKANSQGAKSEFAGPENLRTAANSGFAACESASEESEGGKGRGEERREGGSAARAKPSENPGLALRLRIGAAFEAVGRLSPETGHAEIWLAQGFDPDLCVAVVEEMLRKNARFRTLKYCDGAIAEAHEKRPQARSPAASNGGPVIAAGWTPPLWRVAIEEARRDSVWNRGLLGPPPGEKGCLAPAECLAPEDRRRAWKGVN